jgi:hypothetical protein
MWPSAMTGPASDGAPVHTAGHELGDHEVPQVMQPAVHAESSGQAAKAVGDAVGVDRVRSVRAWENTSASAASVVPQASASLAWASRWARSSSAVSAPTATRRLAWVLVALSTKDSPGTRTIPPAIRTSPWSRSRFDQRTAHSSPRRAPSTTARRRNRPSSRSSASATLSSRAASATAGGCMSVRSIEGGEASRAGLLAIQPRLGQRYHGTSAATIRSSGEGDGAACSEAGRPAGISRRSRRGARRCGCAAGSTPAGRASASTAPSARSCRSQE